MIGMTSTVPRRNKIADPQAQRMYG